MKPRSILLIEPSYPNKYPPLGLMKLAAYHGPLGRGDNVTFIKGENLDVLRHAWDRVYVTTLFTFEWKRTATAIDFAIQAAGYQPERVFVGGIAASLMHESFLNEPRWAGVRFIKGLLDGAPSSALQLSSDAYDFGADDLTGSPIEERVPDYDILDQIEYKYPVHDAYFGYASRGCVRKCSFCGVPALEGAQREMPPLVKLVEGVNKAHGIKKDLVLMDNNITASARYKEVIAEIRDLGFTPGATIARDGKRPVKRRVDFNQGVDARILAKSDMFLREMATICISPLRIAFDHIGLQKVYGKSVRMAADNQITSLSNYMLYNFMDTPVDLYERMRLNISLNEELGIRIWSFPMRYQPVTLKDRSHVGKKWSRYYLRSFQIMLQATRGVVSGNPAFFLRAYGENSGEFERLLGLPHSFIFHREYFESGDGAPQREEYEALRRHLSKRQEEELVGLLTMNPQSGGLGTGHFQRMANDRTIDPAIRNLMHFHALGTNDESKAQSHRLLSMLPRVDRAQDYPEEDEIVEDAGLFDHEYALEASGAKARRNNGLMGLPQAVESSSVIGTGILGLVTTAMYDNPLAIYREYIQNSTDAIAGMADTTEGKVEITIDPSERWLKIWDNGPGLSNDDAPQELVPIGRSNKQMGSDRGFRGIGRLAGLAFAETVTFTTRARRDELVTRVTWNSSRLPSGTAAVGEIEEVVRDCVDVESLPGPGYPDHFFEVEMRGVARHAAGSLLNRDAVRSYVSEVCPVPMAAAFPYALRVEDLSRPNVPLMSLDITLDGDPEPVRRPYGETIQLSTNREDRFTEFEEVHIPSVDCIRDAAVGWIAHSSYLGAVPKGTRIRGIRARVGNIQIGDETIFDSLYSEERFNRWCVGELHILDHRIVPNARRDYFEPGPHLRNLENHLLPILRGIGEKCRAASAARNRTRKALSALSNIEETYELAISGYLAASDAKALAQDGLEQLPSIRAAVLKLNLGTQYIERLDGVGRRLLEFDSQNNPSPLDGIRLPNRVAYQQMFQAIARVASSPRAARDLMEAVVTQTSAAKDDGAGGAQ